MFRSTPRWYIKSPCHISKACICALFWDVCVSLWELQQGMDTNLVSCLYYARRFCLLRQAFPSKVVLAEFNGSRRFIHGTASSVKREAAATLSRGLSEARDLCVPLSLPCSTSSHIMLTLHFGWDAPLGVGERHRTIILWLICLTLYLVASLAAKVSLRKSCWESL